MVKMKVVVMMPGLAIGHLILKMLERLKAVSHWMALMNGCIGDMQHTIPFSIAILAVMQIFISIFRKFMRIMSLEECCYHWLQI